MTNTKYNVLSRTSELSFGELEVAKLIAHGQNNTTIAEILHISIHTVQSRMKKVIAKTDAKNRTQAIAILTMLNFI